MTPWSCLSKTRSILTVGAYVTLFLPPRFSKRSVGRLFTWLAAGYLHVHLALVVVLLEMFVCLVVLERKTLWALARSHSQNRDYRQDEEGRRAGRAISYFRSDGRRKNKKALTPHFLPCSSCLRHPSCTFCSSTFMQVERTLKWPIL